MVETEPHLKKFQKELSAGTVSLVLLAVLGQSAEPTYTPCVSQWDEMHRMALGRGRRRPRSCQLRRQALSSMAFIGEPCPRKTAGIGPDMDAALIENISIGADFLEHYHPDFRHCAADRVMYYCLLNDTNK